MKKCNAYIIMTLSICSACGNREESSEDNITGVYAREYSREILNQESGSSMGTRTIRDTLYIKPNGDGYRVENAKWSMNDYDNNGWQTMKHAEFGPMPAYNAVYENRERVLIAADLKAIPDIVFSTDGKLSVGRKSEIAFVKIK